jgi:hypothetical protein
MENVKQQNDRCYKCPIFLHKKFKWEKLVYGTECFECQAFKKYCKDNNIYIYKDI